jgi:hypothetical protein
MIRFSPLTPDEIETHLTKNNLVDSKTARLRARAAGGSMGRALSGDLVTFTSLRKAMLKVLNALVISNDRTQLLRSSEQLNEAEYRDEFEQRLDVLETLIRDAWMLSLGVEPSQLVNEDLAAELKEISKNLVSSRAGDWILQIEDLREQLIVNINRKVTTDALFLVMAGDVAATKRPKVR